MTATDELRRMLDERGVKWCPSAWDRSTETYWKTADGNGCLATQGETKLRLSFADYLTPEQAIEATLGRGTCKDIAETCKFSDKTRFECSECGYEYSAVGGFGCDYGDEPDFNYCPNCGRKVSE